MPVKYVINHSEGVVYTTAYGKLTDEDLVDFKLALQNDPEFIPGMKELSDLRSVEQFEVTSIGVRKFVLMDKINAEKSKEHILAIIAPEDSVYGTARMYQMMTEENNPNINIFRNIDEARKWLGIK